MTLIKIISRFNERSLSSRFSVVTHEDGFVEKVIIYYIENFEKVNNSICTITLIYKKVIKNHSSF